MKEIQFKTTSTTRISDTVTPVGLYLRFRDQICKYSLIRKFRLSQ